MVAYLGLVCDAGCDRQHSSADFTQCLAGVQKFVRVSAVLRRVETVP
jgi:hypothetical protein